VWNDLKTWGGGIYRVGVTFEFFRIFFLIFWSSNDKND
jgi:hypothetical protein